MTSVRCRLNDDRFDKNPLELILKRKILILDQLEALSEVHVIADKTRYIKFDDNPDDPGNGQYRIKFYVTKEGRKTTWDDIYEIVNSIKPVPYKFI